MPLSYDAKIKTHSCFQSECHPQEFEFPCKCLDAMKCSEEYSQDERFVCVRFQIIKPFSFLFKLSTIQTTWVAPYLYDMTTIPDKNGVAARTGEVS